MCGSFPELLIGRTAVHSGKDPAFVAYDQFLSMGILQPLSQDEARYGSRAAVQATLALSPLCPPKRKSEASFVTSELCHKQTSHILIVAHKRRAILDPTATSRVILRSAATESLCVIGFRKRVPRNAGWQR